MTSPSVILIIDDDDLLGRSLVRLSERTFPGYRCLWARDGVAGVQLAQQHAARLRLVMLDIVMPRMDGNLVAVQIRTLARACRSCHSARTSNPGPCCWSLAVCSQSVN